MVMVPRCWINPQPPNSRCSGPAQRPASALAVAPAWPDVHKPPEAIAEAVYSLHISQTYSQFLHSDVGQGVLMCAPRTMGKVVLGERRVVAGIPKATDTH